MLSAARHLMPPIVLPPMGRMLTMPEMRTQRYNLQPAGTSRHAANDGLFWDGYIERGLLGVNAAMRR